MVEQQYTHHFSEPHLRLATEIARVGMWEWDLLQRQPIWCVTCKAILGYPPESDVSYEDFLSRVYPADHQRVEHMLSKSLRNGTAYDTQYRLVWPDGSLHWIAAKGQGIADRNGKVLRLIGVILDITVQRQTEEIERAVGRQTQTIFESLTDALAHTDRDDRITYMNTQAERMGNVPREQALGRIVWEVYPEFLGLNIQQCHQQAAETRQPAQCEFYNPHLQTWAAFHFYPAEDGGLTVLIQDITRQKSLEHERDRLLAEERVARTKAETARQRGEQLVKQLEREQAFLRAVMEQAPSAMFIAEMPVGKLVLYNQAALQLLGYSALECEDYTGYTLYRAVHRDETPYEAEEYPLARSLLSGETISQEQMSFVREDGNLIYLSVDAAPIRDAQGTIVAAVSIFNDITERYELEQKKDQFVCMASHELRTPLTSIKGNLQLLKRRMQRLFKENDDLISPEGRVLRELYVLHVEPALRQANVESRLINDLLDATSIRSKTLSVVLEPCNLLRIVSNTINDVRVVASPHQVHVEFPKQFEIAVMADSVRIGQVVTNLVTNALKHSAKAQPITVGISLKEGEAQVWVKDLGPGLSPDAQQWIWDRFSSLPGFIAYKIRGGGGLGLGLYISLALVREHGGRMGVESKPGEGSTFWFTLPLRK